MQKKYKNSMYYVIAIIFAYTTMIFVACEVNKNESESKSGSQQSPGSENTTPIAGIDTLESQSSIPAFSKIARGSSHYFFIDTDGKLYAWGANEMGQIGNGGLSEDKIKKLTLITRAKNAEGSDITLTKVTNVDAGNGFSLAIADGKLYSWGDNGNGQLGRDTGSDNKSGTPTEVSGLNNVTDIAVNLDMHGTSFAIADGRLYSWGANDFGQLGRTPDTDNPAETPAEVSGIPGTVTAVAAGRDFSLAVAEGKLYSWGNNNDGRLGRDTSVDSNKIPARIPGISGVTAISVANNFALAIAGGKLYSWGLNSGAKLGNGTSSNEVIDPKHVAEGQKVQGTNITSVPISDVTFIFADNKFCLAVAEGKLYGWGFKHRDSNGFYELTKPTQIPESLDVPEHIFDFDITSEQSFDIIIAELSYRVQKSSKIPGKITINLIK